MEHINPPRSGDPSAVDRDHRAARALRVAVYAIARNEAKHARRWAASARGADALVVADTGSGDGTPELLRDCGVTVQSITVRPWRFDAARNAALALVPADVDVCVSLDLDEVLSPGWRDAIEAAWRPGVTRLWHWFDFDADSQFSISRIHARHGYGWRWPIHEHLHCAGNEICADAGRALTFTHLPDGAKSREAYLPLLERAAREEGGPRMLYYLTRENYYRGRWQRAIDTARQYLAHPAASWHLERCAAMRHAAASAGRLSRPQEAQEWLEAACAAAPDLREPRLELAQLHYEQRRWEEGFTAALAALRITEKPRHFLVSNRCWGARPHELAARCAFRLGRKQEAAAHLRAALRYDPDNAQLRTFAFFMRS